MQQSIILLKIESFYLNEYIKFLALSLTEGLVFINVPISLLDDSKLYTLERKSLSRVRQEIRARLWVALGKANIDTAKGELFLKEWVCFIPFVGKLQLTTSEYPHLIVSAFSAKMMADIPHRKRFGTLLGILNAFRLTEIDIWEHVYLNSLIKITKMLDGEVMWDPSLDDPYSSLLLHSWCELDVRTGIISICESRYNNIDTSDIYKYTEKTPSSIRVASVEACLLFEKHHYGTSCSPIGLVWKDRFMWIRCSQILETYLFKRYGLYCLVWDQSKRASRKSI
jgi:hypothetical protein